jgi:serine/threonine protein kinase
MLSGTLSPGFRISDYQIISLIGQGSYGRIYEAVHYMTQELCALKVEVIGDQKIALEHETEILRNLNSCYFPRFISYSGDREFRCLAMELCGPSFSALLRRLPAGKFSTSTFLRCGIEMLRAIEAIHSQGFVHRDIKPSNFLIRASRSCPLALIDYGLSRSFRGDAGELLPPRKSPGFVVSGKYASLNAHAGKELGRRDDLYSWFYCLMEMALGRLPWAKMENKHHLSIVKRSVDIFQEIASLPHELCYVYRLIRRLGQSEEPHYKLIMSFLCAAMEHSGCSWSDPYDWEAVDLSAISAISLRISPGEQPTIPADLPPAVMPKKLAVQGAHDHHLKSRTKKLSFRHSLGGQLPTFGDLVDA